MPDVSPAYSPAPDRFMGKSLSLVRRAKHLIGKINERAQWLTGGGYVQGRHSRRMFAGEPTEVDHAGTSPISIELVYRTGDVERLSTMEHGRSLYDIGAVEVRRSWENTNVEPAEDLCDVLQGRSLNTPIRGGGLPTQAQEQAERVRLVQLFLKDGYPQKASFNAATYLVRERILEICRTYWETIPTYKDARKLKISRNPAEHFDLFWAGSVREGRLYQHMLREYDAPFISDLRNYLWRNKDKDGLNPNDYQIPPRSALTDEIAKQADTFLGEEAAKAKIAQKHRKYG